MTRRGAERMAVWSACVHWKARGISLMLVHAWCWVDENGAGVGVQGRAVVARRHGICEASLAESVMRAAFARKYGSGGHDGHPA